MSLVDVPGVRVGHWTDPVARTGCTAVLFPAGTVGSGEVRGGAPGTREWAMLAPGGLVQQVDAVVLCGGSAFGLAACDGVVRFCEERGVGFPTPAGPVPIVVGMVLYDLGVGDPSVRPGPAEGMAACRSAGSGPVATGRVGAGTGATVGRWRGPGAARPGGIGSATRRSGGLVVSALVAVNALGDVVAPGATVSPGGDPGASWFGTGTTIGVVATSAGLDKLGCRRVAEAANDAVARVVVPAHTVRDGDAMVAAAVGSGGGSVEEVRLLAVEAVEAAVRAAVEE